LAAWSVKFALMLQLVYPRDCRFVISGADYAQFHADRQPSGLMKLWAGHMEPPGKHGGPALALHDHLAHVLQLTPAGLAGRSRAD
jgi:hypothetical protein